MISSAQILPRDGFCTIYVRSTQGVSLKLSFILCPIYISTCKIYIPSIYIGYFKTTCIYIYNTILFLIRRWYSLNLHTSCDKCMFLWFQEPPDINYVYIISKQEIISRRTRATPTSKTLIECIVLHTTFS